MKPAVCRAFLAGALVIGALTFAVNAASAVATPAAKSGGTISIEEAGAGSSTFDPALETTGIADQIAYFPVFDALFKYIGGKYQPFLASSYKTADNGLELIVTLKHGLKFSDGTPLNAAAVEYNYQRDVNPTNDCSCGSAIKPITSVTTSGQYTVIYHLSAADGSLLSALSTTTAAYMVSPTAAAAEPSSTFALYPVGAGPYKIISDVPGASLILQRWSGYNKQAGVAYANEIKFTFVSSATSAYASLEAGSSQLVWGPNLDTPTLEAAKKNHKDTVVSGPSLGSYSIEINTNKAPFTNPIAREALFEATDPTPIAKSVFGGFAQPTESIPGPGSIPQFPATQKLPGFKTYNPKAARKLVNEVGPFSFTIFPLVATPVEITALEVLQAQWAQVGITATINTSNTESQSILDLGDGDYQTFFTFVGLYPDAQLSMSELLDCPSLLNKSFCDSNVTSLITQAGETYGLGAEHTLLTQAEVDTMVKDTAWLPVVTEPDPWIQARSLQGIPSDSAMIYLQSAWVS